MSPKDAADRLREHSGLPVAHPQLGTSAFVDVVHAVRKGELGGCLEVAVADVIDCLQHLNAYCQSAPESRSELLNFEVIYAISGITLPAIEASIALCKTGRSCGRLLGAVWKIGCAWDALLAGDIDDIHQHLNYEAVARNILQDAEENSSGI